MPRSPTLSKPLICLKRWPWGSRSLCCQIHKRRNILGHIPERLHENVKAVLKEAWGARAQIIAGHANSIPNLVYIEPTDEVGWLLNPLYPTHDIGHVLTGWGTDLCGEVGLAGFYSA